MIDIVIPDFVIFCCSTVLMALLLMELLEWSCVQVGFECPPRGSIQPFVYGENSGPHFWRCAYPESRGYAQSPVNIVGKAATVLEPSQPLCWRGYAEEPLSMCICNDGNTVVLYGNWSPASRPRLLGGPLNSLYEFHSAVFRWGLADDEGGEHTLDYRSYAMELQAVHLKRGIETPRDAAMCKLKDGLAIVSYLFQITEVDNPYLDVVVTNLWRIRHPGSCAHVSTFPLEWLMPSFESKYYSYNGSLTQPPCSEIVTWIVQPESIAISTTQMAQFRKIHSTEGPILSNCRPVQKLHDREIIYFS